MEAIVLSDRSQAQKDKCHLALRMQNPKHPARRGCRAGDEDGTRGDIGQRVQSFSFVENLAHSMVAAGNGGRVPVLRPALDSK
jgi:hypothetical protein